MADMDRTMTRSELREQLAQLEAVAALYPTSTGANEPGRIMAEAVQELAPVITALLDRLDARPVLTPGLFAEIDRRVKERQAAARMPTYCRGRRLVGIGTDARIPCQLSEGHGGPHVFRSTWTDDDGDAVTDGS